MLPPTIASQMRVSSSDGNVGVHHPDLLALEEAFVAGMFFLLGAEFGAAFARLVLHGSLLGLRREAFLDDPKVLEVSEYHS